MKESKFKKFLRRYYRAAKNFVYASKKKKAIVEHKTGLWQTDKWANSFVAGSDADNVVAAALMDKEVNEYFLTKIRRKTFLFIIQIKILFYSIMIMIK